MDIMHKFIFFISDKQFSNREVNPTRFLARFGLRNTDQKKCYLFSNRNMNSAIASSRQMPKDEQINFRKRTWPRSCDSLVHPAEAFDRMRCHLAGTVGSMLYTAAALANTILHCCFHTHMMSPVKTSTINMNFQIFNIGKLKHFKLLHQLHQIADFKYISMKMPVNNFFTNHSYYLNGTNPKQ